MQERSKGAIVWAQVIDPVDQGGTTWNGLGRRDLAMVEVGEGRQFKEANEGKILSGRGRDDEKIQQTPNFHQIDSSSISEFPRSKTQY